MSRALSDTSPDRPILDELADPGFHQVRQDFDVVEGRSSVADQSESFAGKPEPVSVEVRDRRTRPHEADTSLVGTGESEGVEDCLGRQRFKV